jgi:hypothetical protein
MNNTQAHAFFSEKTARERGFSLCPDLDDHDNLVQVTHISFGPPSEDIKSIEDIMHVGTIDSRRFGANHYHLIGQDVCGACICLKMEQQSDRKIVHAKRSRN